MRTAFVQPWEKKVLGDTLSPSFSISKGGEKENGDSLYKDSHGKDEAWWIQVITERFQLDTRGMLFTVRTLIHWNNLSREVVESQYWTPIRFSWTWCWVILSRGAFAKRDWTRWSLKSSSNLISYHYMNPNSRRPKRIVVCWVFKISIHKMFIHIRSSYFPHFLIFFKLCSYTTC